MMDLSGHTTPFAVLGHPIGHSLSPVMHNASLRSLGMDAVYLAFDVAPHRLMDVLRAMRDPLNIAGLVPLFEAIPDVLFAKPDNIFGDGDDIQAVAEAGGWRLTYYLKWDDCPATCLAAHHWSFRVGPRGAVEYLGSGGDPIP